MIGLVDNALW